MSATNTFETDLLLLVFNNTNCSLIGDATGIRGSTTVGSLYISLHTSDPGEAATQTTNETVYTNYVRIAVARTAGAWSVSGNTVSNVAAVTFAACGVTGATLTHWGVGTDPTGTGKLLMSGALATPLVVTELVAPYFTASQLTATVD